MISPFKAVIGGAYKAVERRLLNAIHLRFGLPPELPAEIVAIIKAADRGAAFLEATTLAGFGGARSATFVRAAAEPCRPRPRRIISRPGRPTPRSGGSCNASRRSPERLTRARGPQADRPKRTMR